MDSSNSSRRPSSSLEPADWAARLLHIWRARAWARSDSWMAMSLKSRICIGRCCIQRGGWAGARLRAPLSFLSSMSCIVLPVILHRGKCKVLICVKSLNPLVEYVPHPTRLTPENAVELVGAYDVVLDCTDTPASRYLISDTCVILKKPLVSASALRTEGQLMVLNQPPRPAGYHEGGPCYRCVFPKPPPAETVVSCGDGGILGPVVGVMGVLQALEAIKLITSAETSESTASPTLLLFSAYSTPQFRSIRLRRRKANCAACSATATVTKESLLSGSMDYVQFCGIADPVNLLAPDERITATEYAMKRGKQGVLIDVREKVQFDLCSLEGSMNIPFSEVVALNQEPSQEVEEPTKSMKRLKTVLENQESGIPIYVICRLGNDSQVAVKRLKQLGLGSNETRWVGDVKGGLRSWREEVDPEFPDY